MRIWPAALLLAACSDPAPANPDAAVTPDAYDELRCLIKGDFGDLGSLPATTGNVQGATTVTVTIEPGTARDTFFIRMVPGNGVFAGGLAPGTYELAGVETQYNNCGLCVHIIADITMNGPSKFYFAQSGSITLNSVTSPITGSAQNVELVEIDIGTGQVVAGGCTGRIGSLAFATQ
jgi:hypothetical protein